jgi:hypothetical protein
MSIAAVPVPCHSISESLTFVPLSVLVPIPLLYQCPCHSHFVNVMVTVEAIGHAVAATAVSVSMS